VLVIHTIGLIPKFIPMLKIIRTEFAIIVPIMVLTILVMGLIVIPASAASSAAQSRRDATATTRRNC
jgi:poly-D-alanine transfer protein DltD